MVRGALAILLALVAGVVVLPAAPAAAVSGYWVIVTAKVSELIEGSGHQVEQLWHPANKSLPYNAHWNFVPLGGDDTGYWMITSFYDRCMATLNASTASGARIITATCGSGRNDQWTPVLVRHDNASNLDFYNLVNRKSHLCANIQGGVTDDYADLIQYPCNSTSWNMQFNWFPSSQWPVR